ncbi:hypothetical protein ACLB2K_025816 [Fragaria x ananassa]
MNSYVAVKKISSGSKQGLKEYAAEVSIISRLRHRNLVQLIGWCHEKKLLLVYEFMPNGSLDSHLFNEKSLLTWELDLWTTGKCHKQPLWLGLTGKASKQSDVYSFGVVALEIACGRKPMDLNLENSRVDMVEWVWGLYGEGKVIEAADPKLCGYIDEKQMECLMMVGLWCAHPDYNMRPSI